MHGLQTGFHIATSCYTAHVFTSNASENHMGFHIMYLPYSNLYVLHTICIQRIDIYSISICLFIYFCLFLYLDLHLWIVVFTFICILYDLYIHIHTLYMVPHVLILHGCSKISAVAYEPRGGY